MSTTIANVWDWLVRRLSMIARYRRRPRWSLSAAVLLFGLGLIGLTDAQPQSDAAKPPVSASTPEPVLTHASGSVPRSPGETNKLSYQGKSAEEWLGLLNFNRGSNDKEFVEAMNAFRGMGDAAVPFLREKLSESKTPAESRRTAESRRRAAWALKELGPTAAPAVPDLITAVQDEDETVAAYAAMALGDIGPKAESACAALLEGVRFGNGPAAVALVKIDPDNPALVPTFIEIIKNPGTGRPNPSWQAPGYAAMALQRLGPRAKAAVPALREALGNPGLKIYAAWALLRIAADEPDVVAEANAIVKVKPEPGPDIAKSIEAVEHANPNNFGVEMAFQNLGNALQSARHSEAGLSGQVISEKILPLFAKALDNPNPRIRSAACSALNGLGPAGAPLLPKLLAFLQEDDTSYRGNVLGALSNIAPGDPASLAVLIHLLKDWNDAVRQNACACLTHYGPEAKTAMPALHECLKDRVMWVRFDATVALWRIAHEPPAVSVMQDAIREDQDGHFTSMRILEMLGQSGQQSKESLAILRELTKNWEPEVRTNAQALLERYGDKSL